jgi:ATP-dependent Clp protease ATP-binding subunit ClpB
VAKEVQDLKNKAARVTKVWQEEREELNRVKEVKEELADARRQVDIARSKGDFNKAGELLHSTIPKLELQLHDLEGADETASGPGKKKKKLLAEAVTADAISTIVARHTGIPVSRITGSESKQKALENGGQVARTRRGSRPCVGSSKQLCPLGSDSLASARSNSG